MDRPYCDTCPYWHIGQAEHDIPRNPETRISDDEWREYVRTRRRPPGGVLDRECLAVYAECRRFPPTLTRKAEDDYEVGDWRRTADFDWCGEHPDFPAYLESRRRGESTSAPPDPDRPA